MFCEVLLGDGCRASDCGLHFGQMYLVIRISDEFR